MTLFNELSLLASASAPLPVSDAAVAGGVAHPVVLAATTVAGAVMTLSRFAPEQSDCVPRWTSPLHGATPVGDDDACTLLTLFSTVLRHEPLPWPAPVPFSTPLATKNASVVIPCTAMRRSRLPSYLTGRLGTGSLAEKTVSSGRPKRGPSTFLRTALRRKHNLAPLNGRHVAGNQSDLVLLSVKAFLRRINCSGHPIDLTLHMSIPTMADRVLELAFSGTYALPFPYPQGNFTDD
eukprot:5055863-Pleurochrysis_carterae.AAC.2